MVRALAVMAACLAVACVGPPSADPSVAVEASVAASSPVEFETFVDPMPEPPELTLLPEGDDFEPVIREIFAFRDWLFAHPEREELVDEIFMSECRCNEALRADLIVLRVEGNRILGESSLPEVRIRDVADGVRNVIISRRSHDLRLLDASGAVIHRLDEAGPTRSLLRLQQGSDGRWRAAAIGRIVSE